MVGNLVDNACKWAQSRVAVEVFPERPIRREGRVVRIVVDDDGPGLRRSSASRWRAAAAASTRPSRARASACRSWSSSPASTAAG